MGVRRLHGTVDAPTDRERIAWGSSRKTAGGWGRQETGGDGRDPGEARRGTDAHGSGDVRYLAGKSVRTRGIVSIHRGCTKVTVVKAVASADRSLPIRAK